MNHTVLEYRELHTSILPYRTVRPYTHTYNFERVRTSRARNFSYTYKGIMTKLSLMIDLNA